MLLVCSVRSYQIFLRPFLPPLCRFKPTCSEYMIEAVKKHGPFRGAYFGIWRLCRCNPWSQGGWDPP
ncbi:MAG: membrane protein insertion efficiency factor YidD [Gemmataceae bacterium]